MRTWLLLIPIFVSACRCGPGVTSVNPTIGVSAPGLDFKQVKVGASKQLTLQVKATTNAALTITSVHLDGAGKAAFALGDVPASVGALGSEPLTVTFSPTSVAAFTASLTIETDDPETPAKKIALAGEGAQASIQLTIDCDPARGCTPAVVQDPPSIDFGQEPLVRSNPVDPTSLPTLVVVNVGSVALDVSALEFAGADGAAFKIGGNNSFPDGGLVLGPAEGFNAPLQFVPTSQSQTSYAGEAVIHSDDPEHPTISVALAGTLQPNQPPVVCANLVRVTPQNVTDTPRDYSSSAQWAPLLIPPAGGYDFTSTRDVRPGDLVQLSAVSDTANAAACSSDPEDGRTGLTFAWTLVSTPVGAEALQLGNAAAATAQLRPSITGTYVVRLTVTDARGSSSSTTLTFVVSIKQDFVTQLQWEGYAGVDLDLHLVRPSAVTGNDAFTGAFQFFTAGPASRTSGDLNGFAWRTRNNNVGAGYDFDWGDVGSIDDPILNLDDTGNGDLVENISLNYPEHDPLCATARCTYRVMAHYYRDARNMAGAACSVDGGVDCADGEACSCAATERCVASSAPAGAAPRGTGKCFVAPRPVVRFFFFGSAAPAATIPLQTLTPPDDFALGAPCAMWHVADVVWPALNEIGSLPDGGTPPPVVTPVGADALGYVSSPALARFGVRNAPSVSCSPDVTFGTIDWYDREP